MLKLERLVVSAVATFRWKHRYDQQLELLTENRKQSLLERLVFSYNRFLDHIKSR